MLQRYLQVLMSGGKIVEEPRPLEDGLAAFAAGDYETAEGLLIAALAAKPDEPRVLTALGLIALAAGRAEEAASHLTAARRRLPSDRRLAVALADCQRLLGHLPAAAEAYRAALRTRREDAETWRKLGEVLYELGRKDEALAALNQAVYHDRRDIPARLLITCICLDQDDTRRALAQLHMIERLEPGRRDVHGMLAIIHERTGDFRQMAVELEHVIALGGADLATCWRLANAYLMFGRREDALRAFQQTATFEAEPGPALLAVAQVAEELGHVALALESWHMLAGVKAYQGEANAAIERLRAAAAHVAADFAQAA